MLVPLIFFFSQAFAADGCMTNSDCPKGTVCATVRGEYPGSCAGTGFDKKLSSVNESKGCMKDSDCGEGKVCATVRGDYPGSCAQGVKQIRIRKNSP